MIHNAQTSIFTFVLLFVLSISVMGQSSDIYHERRIDFNKNGEKDIYEDPIKNIEQCVDDLVSKIGKVTGSEAKALGYTNIYSPVLDIARDQRWGRIVEYYGEDPYLVSQMGKTMVNVLQEQEVVSTPKHFAVYSAPKGGRDAQSRTDPQAMETLYLPPFKAGIKDTGALGVMSSYNDYNAIPVSASSQFLTEILRNDWGFEGYVVSDSRAVGRSSKDIRLKHSFEVI